jgi:uncharacterized membrane protein
VSTFLLVWHEEVIFTSERIGMFGGDGGPDGKICSVSSDTQITKTC